MPARRRQFHSAASPRGGFSLFELLIVMSILVTVAAMAAPNLMVRMRESKVFEAADEVRELMGEARRIAIDTGIDYEFRYELNGSNVVVLPSELEQNTDEAKGTSTTIDKYVRISLELSEDIRLQAAEGVEELASRLEPVMFGELGAELSQKQWSAPLMFRFDGTSDDFELRVQNDDDLTSTITVRGLTGAARTSPVYQESN
ncbi:pilus assembly FimT family protein [Fuerstiella marisgermanici]|uniref:Tfp pilus assembly protein n=1 Tax=Fuerstiella marisgermanici TaxID=1891926 RepID=A0A1P8WCC4_9PLAN|nr:prepilin-type N-terminal cleavage/methylation domain-containing protein [Fuerstiella marisgermanici]APZ91699.1 Tfp pilus assembly protein [Fuerstiella marisgermanici]